MGTRWETTLRESGGGSTAGRAGARTVGGSLAGDRYFTYEDRRNSAAEPGRDSPPAPGAADQDERRRLNMRRQPRPRRSASPTSSRAVAPAAFTMSSAASSTRAT